VNTSSAVTCFIGPSGSHCKLEELKGLEEK